MAVTGRESFLKIKLADPLIILIKLADPLIIKIKLADPLIILDYLKIKLADPLIIPLIIRVVAWGLFLLAIC